MNKDSKRDAAKSTADLLTVPTPPDLIRQAASPRGLHAIPIEGVGLVNALEQTGGPVDPSTFRDQLIDEMRHKDVEDPNQILELDSTAVVRVVGAIPAGARRGDPIDLKIISPEGSRATDLRGGWLLDTRLRHQQVLDQRLRQSDLMAIAMGPVLTRKTHDIGSAEALALEGRVLGGGRIQVTRKLGLVLRPEYQHVMVSKAITAAINERFFFFDGTTRRGIAKAIEDDYIEIEVHPRYRENVYRMMAVINSIAISPRNDSQARLERLAGEMQDVGKAAGAALQLEAMGENAIPTLVDAAKSSNPELRFYAAEALAYLDRIEAVELLEQAIRSEPAFRQPAFVAMQTMKSPMVVPALKRLLNEPSLETRYAALVTLRKRADGRQMLSGKIHADSFRQIDVASTASPSVVVSLRENQEICLFGNVPPLDIATFVLGPGGLVIKPDETDPGRLRISRFQTGQEDRLAVVPNSIPTLIDGIVTVGGNYGDVVSVLRNAKDKGYLTAQLAFDPLPQAFRTYYRDDEAGEEAEEETE
ncbi:HEAT repeat domain-containing protein [Stieleria varia]|nr:HEAT repeat domain-containing protein [Stieleria varia]